jgi:hypothetical protein
MGHVFRDCVQTCLETIGEGNSHARQELDSAIPGDTYANHKS